MGSESPCGRLYIFGPESICLPLYTEVNDISDSDISLLTGVTYTCVFVPLGIKGKNISAIEFSCGDEILCSSYGEDLKQRIFLADPSSNAKCKNSWYELFQSNGDDIGSRYKASFELEFPQGSFSFIFKVKDKVKKTNRVMSSGLCHIEKPEVKVPEIGRAHV